MSWLWVAAAIAAVIYVLGTLELERQAAAARASEHAKEAADAD